MSINRFLLIKSLGGSIWDDVDHVMVQLLAADMTNRQPVVYWGMESLYSESIGTNAFDLFFEPINKLTVHDVAKPEYTFYPPVWRHDNVMVEDSDRMKYRFRDLKSMLSSNANVVVSDMHYPVSSLLPMLGREHWAFGKTPHQVYRLLYDRFLKPRPEIKREIRKFINTHPDFRDERPIIGVHVRGNAIVNEVAQIYDLNDFYRPYIWQYFVRYNARHLLLITDSKKILRQYKKLYGMNDILMVTDSKKVALKERIPTYLLSHPNKRHKGVELVKDTIEVIKDTYLAAECDFFIGNGYSSLSNAVLRLKDWAEPNMKLLY